MHDPVGVTVSGKYDANDLMPADFDQRKLAEEEAKRKQRATSGDPFEDLGVSAADKMSFFLLKWVFNAIKRESSDEDPAFKGQPYISKSDLVKQLGQNPELLRALGYDDQLYLRDSVKLAASVKDGFLTWAEFLDFFFLKDATGVDRMDGNDWWN